MPEVPAGSSGPQRAEGSLVEEEEGVGSVPPFHVRGQKWPSSLLGEFAKWCWSRLLSLGADKLQVRGFAVTAGTGKNLRGELRWMCFSGG